MKNNKTNVRKIYNILSMCLILLLCLFTFPNIKAKASVVDTTLPKSATLSIIAPNIGWQCYFNDYSSHTYTLESVIELYHGDSFYDMESFLLEVFECQIYAVGNNATNILHSFNDNIEREDPFGITLGVETGTINFPYSVNVEYVEETLDFYIVYYEPIRMITLNANGGAGKMDAFYTNPNYSTLKLPMNEYERPGYVFMGWSDSPNGIVKYNDNAMYNNSLIPNMLYAIWDDAYYTDIYNEGYNDGLEVGNELLDATQQEIYNRAFAEGRNSALTENTIWDLIPDTIAMTWNNLFAPVLNFEILGISVAEIIFTLIGIVAVIFIVKITIGLIS